MDDLRRVIIEMQDHLAPRLDTYEQAVYLYILRHSVLLDPSLREVVIGFKSARKKMPMGIGEEGKPMSEATCYKKLQSLAAKGCLEILDSTRTGTKVRIKLPEEIPGVVVGSKNDELPSLEEMDFFADEANRRLILTRDQGTCFYCMRKLDSSNWLIEHVRSRPEGDNSYRNVVAACRGCNNRKGSKLAQDFLRDLYRDGLLSTNDLEQRLKALSALEAGELKPLLV